MKIPEIMRIHILLMHWDCPNVYKRMLQINNVLHSITRITIAQEHRQVRNTVINDMPDLIIMSQYIDGKSTGDQILKAIEGVKIPFFRLSYAPRRRDEYSKDTPTLKGMGVIDTSSFCCDEKLCQKTLAFCKTLPKYNYLPVISA